MEDRKAMEPTIFDMEKHNLLLHLFADVHIACIKQDHTIATFTPPLDRDRIDSWWRKQAHQVSAGDRDIIFIIASDGRTLAGVVMLSKPYWETGPFRGYVEKLLVSPLCRRVGVARALMLKVEEVAREKGRTLLMLDTETGSPAEAMYPKLGYTKVGVVPGFSISPKDGGLRSETFFYKDLSSSGSSP